MEVGFCIFDGMTALDFVGAHDPIARLDGRTGIELSVDVCARKERVSATDLTIAADRRGPELGRYDVVVVRGGSAPGTCVTTPSLSTGCARPRRVSISPPCAPARCCWAQPAI